MAGQSKALRIGIITAAVVGTVAIPATALAASLNGIGMRAVTSASPVTGAEWQARTSGDAHEGAGPAHGRGGAKWDQHLEALAASLGVSVDTLKAAMEATRAELKDQRPATPADHRAFAERHLTTLAGKLNVSVDALKAAITANRPARPAGKGPDGARHGGPARAQHLQALATALNVTPEALRTAMQEARKETKPATRPADAAARQAHHDAYLAALAAKLNVSVDALKAAIEQVKPARPAAASPRAMLERPLAAMVANGRITQAQADQILADLNAGKPVIEVLREFMPQLRGGDHRPASRGPQGARA